MSMLEFLVVDCRFSVPPVSNVLCVSVRTVHQRMSEYGICDGLDTDLLQINSLM